MRMNKIFVVLVIGFMVGVLSMSVFCIRLNQISGEVYRLIDENNGLGGVVSAN